MARDKGPGKVPKGRTSRMVACRTFAKAVALDKFAPSSARRLRVRGHLLLDRPPRMPDDRLRKLSASGCLLFQRKDGLRGKRLVFAGEASGQSTVEYALVLLAFLAMLLALAAVWHVAREGGLQRLATTAASHALGGEGTFGGMRDIVLF